MKTISSKISILYIFLAIINITFFTIMISMNQIDLITENTKYKSKEIAYNIYTNIYPFIKEINEHEQKYIDKVFILSEID